jgi:hypothetical protein
VSFRLVSSSAPAPNQASYVYRVTARTSDVGQIIASLALLEQGGQWLVTSLNETGAS